MKHIIKLDYTNNCLRSPSIDVQGFGRDIEALAGEMIETMFAANGVGLSAPQVGENINMFVMRTAFGLKNDTRDSRIVINPKTNRASGSVRGIEGCLSIPGVFGTVERHLDVNFSFSDASGKRWTQSATGLEARVYQHEFDHLLGTLFIDRAVGMFCPITK